MAHQKIHVDDEEKISNKHSTKTNDALQNNELSSESIIKQEEVEGETLTNKQSEEKDHDLDGESSSLESIIKEEQSEILDFEPALPKPINILPFVKGLIKVEKT